MQTRRAGIWSHHPLGSRRAEVTLKVARVTRVDSALIHGGWAIFQAFLFPADPLLVFGGYAFLRFQVKKNGSPELKCLTVNYSETPLYSFCLDSGARTGVSISHCHSFSK